MNSQVCLSAALFIGAGLVASPAGAQQAKDILDTALQKYEQRMDGIENYTLVQEVLGAPVTMYFERSTVDGHTVFVPAAPMPGGSNASAGASDPWREMSRIRERAVLAGKKDINGTATYEIRIDDPQDLDFGRSMVQSQGNAEFTLQHMTMWLDTKDYVIRQMELAGEMKRNGKTSPIDINVEMLDYRNVKGMLHPFRTVMHMQGIAEAGDVSEEDIARARESLARLDEQMAKMSDDQRAMMQRMMGNQLEKLRDIVESGGTEFDMSVTDLRVNEGPPGE